jgi:hypothetical protein
MERGLSLEWRHWPNGVELVDLPRRTGPLDDEPDSILDVEVSSHGRTFRRCQSARHYPIRHTVDDLESPVVVHFINAHDDEACAQFLARFGFLYEHQTDCERDAFLQDQRVLKNLLALAGSDQPEEAAKAINKRIRHTDSLIPVLDGRRLSFALRNLYGLMLREIVMVVEKEARLTKCQHCDKAFLTGPTTGRRSHAAYCSDRCRVAAMRVRNSER